MPLSQGEEPLLDRQDLGDQFRSSERRSTGAGIATEAMPEPKQSAIERKRLAAEACRRWGRGEIEGAEQVARQVGLTELPPADDVFEGTGQAITAQDAGERLAQHRPQHVGAARRRNPIDHERARDERPEPPFVAIGPMAGFIDVEHRFVSDALMRLNDLAEEVDLVARLRHRIAELEQLIEVEQKRNHEHLPTSPRCGSASLERPRWNPSSPFRGAGSRLVRG